ncbi:hypothetical protein, partial [Legionella anisa]|uniref:hypothetical protein n=1 Tax=Legionella anisa TaxID=28082 RepID=UPI0019803570
MRNKTWVLHGYPGEMINYQGKGCIRRILNENDSEKIITEPAMLHICSLGAAQRNPGLAAL